MIDLKCRHVKTIGSTNNEVIRLAEKGESEGLVLTADFQTHGRGRGKRIWESPRGKNLILSLLLRPKVGVSRLSGLTLVTAHAVQDALKRLDITAKIKRPNDVLVEGKKICGILTESRSKGGNVEWCVVGVGINVNAERGGIPNEATSLKILGKKCEVTEIKELFLEEFKKRYREYAGTR